MPLYHFVLIMYVSTLLNANEEQFQNCNFWTEKEREKYLVKSFSSNDFNLSGGYELIILASTFGLDKREISKDIIRSHMIRQQLLRVKVFAA